VFINVNPAIASAAGRQIVWAGFDGHHRDQRAALAVRAQRFRRWYRAEVLKLFEHVDAIIAPATPCTAPAIGQKTFVLDGVELPVRPNIGIYTQPISFIGLPVVAVPVPLNPMPIAVQVIAPPWREDIALRIAYALEQAGVCVAPRPSFV